MLTLLALMGCSEYALNSKDDVQAGRDSDVVLGECGFEYTDAAQLEVQESCVPEPVVGSWTPVIEWTTSITGDAYTTPAIGNLTDDNGDGLVNSEDTPDVVVANTTGVIFALNGSDGSFLWSAGNFGAEPASPAIGDVNGDGRPDVVGAGSGGTGAFDGSTGSPLWSVSSVPAGRSAICGAVGLYDLEGDGTVEVVVGNLVLNGADGGRRFVGAYGAGAGHSYAGAMGVAADIDQDGVLEVVTGNALYDPNGNVIWHNGRSDGFVAVGNFDSDSKGEIVVADQGTLRLQDDDGTVLWELRNFTGGTIGPPTIADFDNDGMPEIGVAGNNVYRVVEHDGTPSWRRTVEDQSSGFTGSAVFDFEGDGIAEVVYADESSVWVFDGATGEPKLKDGRHSSATCSEYPAIADVDGDGHAEIIYTSSAYTGSTSGVTVIGDAGDTWQSARPVWNQHGYSVTHVDADSLVVSNPDTNWLEFNTFRSGDVLAGQQGELADLITEIQDVCELCDENRAVLSYRIGNQGLSPVETPMSVMVTGVVPGGQVELAQVEVEEFIDVGMWTASLTVELDITGLDLRALVLSVDHDRAVGECDDDNNSETWSDGICQ